MKTFIFALGVMLAFTPFPLCAEQIVSASFSGGSEQVSLVGLTADESPLKPDGANATGESWLLAGGGAYDVWMRDNAARMHNGGAVGIALGNRESGLVTISAEITFEEPQSQDGENEGKAVAEAVKIDPAQAMALLGFYSSLEKKEFADPYKNFTGIKVLLNGSLQLLVKGEPSGDPVSYGGNFDPHVPAVLTYSVDTSSGALTAVTFGSSSTKYSFSTTAFTREATAFAGFGGSLGNHPLHVEFRNFEVTAKPL